MPQTDRLGSLPAHIRRQMKAWNVPGVGLGIVTEGRTLLAEGFGRADTRRGVPVTVDTPFAICSCSKAFTCFVLAMLAEEGVIDWDRPVRDYLPDFAMYDPFATERLTSRDLVTHRSGLPRHDDVWCGSSASRQTLVTRLRHLQPTADLRARYQYQNLMYMTAGYLIGVVTDSSWEAQVQSRILDPLGMTSTTFDIASMEASKIAARPHDSTGRRPTRIPYRSLDAIGPAGSINSTVNDMLKWVDLHLTEGRVGRRQLVSAKLIRSLQVPHMCADQASFDELQLTSYALGWSTFSYRGHRMVSHSGGIDGFRCRTTLLPDAGVGIVCYTNGSTDLPHQLTWETADRVLNLTPLPWARRYRRLDQDAKAETARGRRIELRERKRATAPSRRLALFAGCYEHAGYGTVSIKHSKGALRVAMKGYDVSLRHWHYDVFEFTPPRADPLKIHFLSDAAGHITALQIPLQEGADDISFTRVAESSRN